MSDTTRPGRWFENVPWWMVSMGLHAVVLLGAALIYMDQLLAEVTVCGFIIDETRSQKFVEIEVPRDVFERRGIPEDSTPTALTEAALFFPSSLQPEDSGAPGIDSFIHSTDFFPVNPGLGVGVDRALHSARISTSGFRGPGGAYYTRGAGCAGPRHPGCKGTESAVLASLKWLARHQAANGSWSAGSMAACCGGKGESEYDTGVSALALLAFLGAGYTHYSKDVFEGIRFGDVVKRGLQWLIGGQDPEGCVGPRGPKYLYNHAIAALALSEAYGMTSSDILKESAQKAVDFLVGAQNPGRGWRYSYKGGENDSSVTGWAVMALKSAELSELRFPRKAYDGALAWLNEATERGGSYRVGYSQAGTGKVFEPGVNERFADHPAMTAVGVMSRIFITKKMSDPVQQGAQLLLSDLPAWEPHRIDFYYWYYASLALFQKDGPDGPMWRKWNEPMKAALVPHQATAKDGCQNGSWNPEEDRWGRAGGRVYATAINSLTLEVYYRYASVFGVNK